MKKIVIILSVFCFLTINVGIVMMSLDIEFAPIETVFAQSSGPGEEGPPEEEGSWAQVCCGPQCHFGEEQTDYCIGNGTYFCCKP